MSLDSGRFDSDGASDLSKDKAGSRCGMLIAGCEPGCGKTVVLTGLAATLREEGFRVRALKPVCLGSRRSAEAELAFISTIGHTPLTYPVTFVDRPTALNPMRWRDAISVAEESPVPVFIELPAAVATPLRSDDTGRWLDVADLAAAFKLPCLLVAKEGRYAVEQLILNATYLIASAAVDVMGLVTVEVCPETTPERQQQLLQTPPAQVPPPELIDPDTRATALAQRTGVPYLGCIKYSPSISVSDVNQGNLIKTTSAGLDLLPIIKMLNLRLCL